MRRLRRTLSCGLALAGLACAPDRPPIAERLAPPAPVPACAADRWASPEVTDIATGLATPWGIVVSGDSVAYVSERAGHVSLVDLRGVVPPRRIATLPVTEIGENGLLGVAAAPGGAPGVVVAGVFSRPGHSRSLLTRALRRTQRVLGLRVGTDFVIQVHHVRPDGSTRLVADAIPAATLHGGGALAVEDDSSLLLAVGDSRDPWVAQDANDPRGKLLRVRYAATGVATPDAGIAVIALGVRNSQGLATLPDGRWLFLDHGPSGAADEAARVGRDELNVWTAGANYGWPMESGIHDDARHTSPIYEWTAPTAPAGLLVSTAPTTADADSAEAFVAALRAQGLYRLALQRRTDEWQVTCADRLDVGDVGRLRALAAHPLGGLLVATSNRDSRGVPRPGDDRILWIRPRTD